MDWYKQSKLVDKQHPTDDLKIHNKCMYCDRWETHPHNERDGMEESIWKLHKQLDMEERESVARAENEGGVSHGMCSHCKDIISKIQNVGLNPHEFNKAFDPSRIRNVSLGLANPATSIPSI